MMTTPSNFIATQSDAQRADLRKMFADKGTDYEQELYKRDRHSWHVFRALYWQLTIYDEKHGISTKPQSRPPTSSLAPYPGHDRPLSAISKASVETEVGTGLVHDFADDSTLVNSPTSSETVDRFPAVPGSG